MIRHPEVPAHHTALTFSLRVNARASKDDGRELQAKRGRRPPISGLPEIGSLSAQVGQGRLAMARPAGRGPGERLRMTD